MIIKPGNYPASIIHVMPDLVKHPPFPQGAAAEVADDALSTDCEEAESEAELADDPMVECGEVWILNFNIANMHHVLQQIDFENMGDLSGWRTWASTT